MKWFEYEYSIGNNPDTRILWIQGESDTQVAEILSRYSGDTVSPEDLSECKPEYIEKKKRFYKRDRFLKVVRGELV